MALTIARMTLSDPRTWSANGNSLSLSGIYTPSGVSTAAIVAEFMNVYYGLSNLADNPDETVYPLSYSGESRIDGYYLVRSATCTPIERALDMGYAEWTLDLERIAGFANPLFETTFTALIRTNSHSITTGSALLTGIVRDTALDYSFSVTGTTVYSKASEDGTMAVPYYSISSPTLGYIRNAQQPAYYYAGGCKLEFQLNGTWYEWTGRQIPRGMAGIWRMSNGLIMWNPNTSTVGDCDFSVWNGAGATPAWESTTFRPIDYSSGTAYDFKFACGTYAGSSWVDPTIIRNDPEQVTLRFDGMYGHIQYMTMRRGCNHIEWTSVGNLPYGSSSPRPGVRVSTAAAASAVTGGIRRTSDDSNGNRFILLCDNTISTDLVNGKIYTTNVTTTATFCIALELNGTASVMPYSYTAIKDDFFVPVSTKTMVVAR